MGRRNWWPHRASNRNCSTAALWVACSVCSGQCHPCHSWDRVPCPWKITSLPGEGDSKGVCIFHLILHIFLCTHKSCSEWNQEVTICCGQTRVFLWPCLPPRSQRKVNKVSQSACSASKPCLPARGWVPNSSLWTSQPCKGSPSGSSWPDRCVKETSKLFYRHFGTFLLCSKNMLEGWAAPGFRCIIHSVESWSSRGWSKRQK